jgi:SRSO17 transposase
MNTSQYTESHASSERFEDYLDYLSGGIGHAARVVPLRQYCTGLMLPLKRKSVEPMAAKMAPRRVGAVHQSMHHFVAKSPWNAVDLLKATREWALPKLVSRGKISAWIIDDTGVPKKGKHSVGVIRQYCGQIGKRESCQVAVTLSVANEVASLPVAHQLYLPEAWAQDRERRSRAGVPEEFEFQTKNQIALAQIESLLRTDVPKAPVLVDSAYGDSTALRDKLEELGLKYSVQVSHTVTVWPKGQEPLGPKPYNGRGRRAKRLRRDKKHQPSSVKALAIEKGRHRFRSVVWRAGTNGWMRSRLLRLRVRVAHRDYWRSELRPEQWLLIEWPEDEKEPTKYWLCNLPKRTTLRDLVRTAKLRWRIERDYQELEDEIGLGHYEGRGWLGYHHHAALSIAAYAFLAAERCLFPPEEPDARPVLETPPLPADFRPRGAPNPAGTPQSDLHRHRKAKAHRRLGRSASSLSMLPASTQIQCEEHNISLFLTQ